MSNIGIKKCDFANCEKTIDKYFKKEKKWLKLNGLIIDNHQIVNPEIRVETWTNFGGSEKGAIIQDDSKDFCCKEHLLKYIDSEVDKLYKEDE